MRNLCVLYALAIAASFIVGGVVVYLLNGIITREFVALAGVLSGTFACCICAAVITGEWIDR